MKEIDIIICLKERNKNQKNIKKVIMKLRSLNVVTNKIDF